jgi:hypothetical protein
LRSLLLATVLLAGCGPEPTREQQAITVAYDHARDRFAGSNPDYWLPPEKVEDHGDYWLIKFSARPGWVGNQPQVEVRKSDLKVLGSINTQ